MKISVSSSKDLGLEDIVEQKKDIFNVPFLKNNF